VSSINSLILFGIEKNCPMSGRCVFIPAYKNGNETDSRNYHGISVLSASYKMLSIILLSRLNPYLDEIIGDL
jgi:hypothetical protein